MKNIDTINKEIAKVKNLPLDTITKINDYYWNTVKNSLRSVDYQFIHIKKIGTFEVSFFKITRQIVQIRKFIYNVRRSKKYNETTREAIIKVYKEKYRKCVAMRREVEKTINFLETYRNNDDSNKT